MTTDIEKMIWVRENSKNGREKKDNGHVHTHNVCRSMRTALVLHGLAGQFGRAPGLAGRLGWFQVAGLALWDGWPGGMAGGVG